MIRCVYAIVWFGLTGGCYDYVDVACAEKTEIVVTCYSTSGESTGTMICNGIPQED